MLRLGLIVIEESEKKMPEQAEQTENIRPTFMDRIKSYIYENAWDKAVAHLIGRGRKMRMARPWPGHVPFSMSGLIALVHFDEALFPSCQALKERT